MRFFIIRLLMKLSGGLAPEEISKVDTGKMEEWLTKLSSTEEGYKDYYTFRKKQLLTSLTVPRGDQEYWMTLGRLQELQYMNGLSSRLLNKKKK